MSEGQSLHYRLRGAYLGHRVYSDGDGTVLVDPEVTRDLRSAAELARAEGRIAAGLLYGRFWTDDEGGYLVVDGFLEAGAGENRGDRAGDSRFRLSGADLRLLRQDAQRMYSAAVEVGWWRSRDPGGGFGPADYDTQAALVPPGGVGLLVYATGPDWGAAYLDPDGELARETGAEVSPARPHAEVPAVPEPEPEPEPVREPEPVPAGHAVPAPGAAGGTAAGSVPGRTPALKPPPEPVDPVRSPQRVPYRELRGVKGQNPAMSEPGTPTDVKLVIAGLCLTIVLGVIIIGVIIHSLFHTTSVAVFLALAVALVAFAALAGFVWFTRTK
jgi:hypothetical protein